MSFKSIISLCFLVIFSSILIGAVPAPGADVKDVTFASYFKDKTMRLDYFHSGNATEDRFAVDRILSDGPWPGSKTQLIDRVNLGLYQFRVYDKADKTLLYSRGFATVFGEWQTTGEAKKVWGTFHESMRFPWPLKAVKVVLSKRDKQNNFAAIWSTEVDPSNRQVTPADIKHSYKVYPIIESGPSATKLDIVILGDGYSEAEMPKFRKDVKRVTDALFSAEPYKSRKSDFNVRAVETPSPVSGVNRPHPGIFKRTPLSVHYSSFDSERYALTYDNRKVRDVASAVPYEFTIILMNERTYGGGGIYKLYMTMAADNAFYRYLVIHELGHHLAALADEYYTSSVSYELDSKVTVEPWELNVTALLDKNNFKWKHLVDKSTPIPTPWMKKEFDSHSLGIQKERNRLRKAKVEEKIVEDLFLKQQDEEEGMFKKMKYNGKIGAFEGASYLSHGLYRSSTNCIMFTRTKDFCPVCKNALNRVIDQYIR
jgi:IgA Peptidase M64/Peptidase M64 N-terminus